MRRLAVNTGRPDPRLSKRCPAAGQALWDAFNAMGSPASGGAFVYLTQQEIAAYCSNYGTRFTPWELDMIRTFDRIAASIAEKHKQAQK